MENTDVFSTIALISDQTTTNTPDVDAALKFWNILQTVIIVVITVFVILGNITNIFIISKSIKTFGVTGYFMISLAFADLGVGILVTPLCIGASIFHEWREIYGWPWCEVTGLVVAALCAISIYSITFLTVDKFVYIVHPLTYELYLEPCKCRVLIVLTWIVCFGYFIVHKFWWNSYYYDSKAYICTIDFPKEWPFTVFVIATIVIPPAILIVFCNYKTYKVARKHAVQIEQVLKSVKNSSTNSRKGGKNITENSVINNIATQQWRALKMNILIAGAFLIAWGPYSIIQVILGLSDIDIPQPIVFIIQWIALANSFWNSLIYFHLNVVYRSRAIKLFKKIACQSVGQVPQIHSIPRVSVNGQRSTEE